MLFKRKFTKKERDLLLYTKLRSDGVIIEFFDPEYTSKHIYAMWIFENTIPNYFDVKKDEWNQFVSAQSNTSGIYDFTRSPLNKISEQQWKDMVYFFNFFVMHCDYANEFERERLGDKGLFHMLTIRGEAIECINLLKNKSQIAITS